MFLRMGLSGAKVEIEEYMTEDGGKTWNNILFIDEHTGFNEIHMDPRNPDILYAASHQRRRHVYTYVGGDLGQDCINPQMVVNHGKK